MKFDFAKHKICSFGDGFGDSLYPYIFFDCILCGVRWERCDRTYLAEGETVLGQCCPTCSVRLYKQGATYEDWTQQPVSYDPNTQPH